MSENSLALYRRFRQCLDEMFTVDVSRNKRYLSSSTEFNALKGRVREQGVEYKEQQDGHIILTAAGRVLEQILGQATAGALEYVLVTRNPDAGGEPAPAGGPYSGPPLRGGAAIAVVSRAANYPCKL